MGAYGYNVEHDVKYWSPIRLRSWRTRAGEPRGNPSRKMADRPGRGFWRMELGRYRTGVWSAAEACLRTEVARRNNARNAGLTNHAELGFDRDPFLQPRHVAA